MKYHVHCRFLCAGRVTVEAPDPVTAAHQVMRGDTLDSELDPVVHTIESIQSVEPVPEAIRLP